MTKLSRLRPAVRWPGGKTCLLRQLLPLLPPHHTYVEPFAGGLALFLAKPRSSVEIVNDLHGDLINFYRCVRFHCEPLLAELDFVLNSRQEFKDFIAQPGLTDLQRAARWFVRNKIGFGGSDTSFGVSVAHGLPSRKNRMETIRLLSQRLDQATIENISWSHCLDLYDRPTTFFFLDPPYLDCDPKVYPPWHKEDVIRLRTRLDQLSGKWLLTFNDHPTVRDTFSECHIIPVERARGINNKNGASTYVELIIHRYT